MTAAAEKESFGRDQVIKIISSVIKKVEHSGDDSRLSIFTELKELERIIEEARSEIGLARPGDIKDKHIPTATDELDAVVEATAEASGKIMDACDVIQEKAAEAGDAGGPITDEVMKIYEACSFQDITGQRITKVVTTLKTIEDKVHKLVQILGDKLPIEDQGDEGDTRTGDERLLNGPQMPDKAISQDDIDALLAGFDDN
ncbi:MAG: protein phosphatase CheZ [Alphaproteobacteria bacterium]|nr:protein phosphatase CheZ [Alphaproteobacteria bacterium]